MPHPASTVTRDRLRQRKAESRYTVGLGPGLAHQVQRYAETVDMSMSKAIAALVRLGLENQNLAKDDPKQEDRLVDEFRALILGR